MAGYLTYYNIYNVLPPYPNMPPFNLWHSWGSWELDCLPTQLVLRLWAYLIAAWTPQVSNVSTLHWGGIHVTMG